MYLKRMNQALHKRTVADIPIFEFEQVESTQDLAREMVEENLTKLNLEGREVVLGELYGVVSATNQTKGRGRFQRTWESVDHSSMLATFIVAKRDANPMIDVAQLMVTVCDVIHVNGPNARIKWPNDVIIETQESKKVGGTLTEIVGDFLLIGIGINITSDAYPLELKQEATSLEENGYNIIPAELVNRIVEEYSRQGSHAISDSDIWKKYKSKCATLGKYIRVDAMSESLVGSARDIADDGALIVEKDSGEIVSVSEGDVVHVRPANV